MRRSVEGGEGSRSCCVVRVEGAAVAVSGHSCPSWVVRGDISRSVARWVVQGAWTVNWSREAAGLGLGFGGRLRADG